MNVVNAAPDVAIIGGGIMGCATALRLAQRGARVVIVEKGIPGAEASSAAAGMLAPQMEADGPGPMFDLTAGLLVPRPSSNRRMGCRRIGANSAASGMRSRASCCWPCLTRTNDSWPTAERGKWRAASDWRPRLARSCASLSRT